MSRRRHARERRCIRTSTPLRKRDMADEFDPYYTWLGISAKDQPANHYRLLGIEAFEANPNVIEHAADRQMGHLRTFQTGVRGKLCEKLLNEVAAAKILLLNSPKKASYDQGLRRSLLVPLAVALVGEASERSSPSAELSDAEFFTGLIGAAPSRPDLAPAQSPRPGLAAAGARFRWWMAVLPAAGILAVLAAIWLATRGSDQSEPKLAAANTSPAQNSAVPNSAQQNSAQRPDSGPSNSVPQPAPASPSIAPPKPLSSPALTVSPEPVEPPTHTTPASKQNDGALVFGWPVADRHGMSVSVDGMDVPPPERGEWEYRCSAGEHRVLAKRLGYKEEDTLVTVQPGQRRVVDEEFIPKSTLLLDWPLNDREGAELRLDGELRPTSDQQPWPLVVEPGAHSLRISRGETLLFAGRILAPPDARRPLKVPHIPDGMAVLLISWSVENRRGGELTVDGRHARYNENSELIAIPVLPGQHQLHFTKPGCQPVDRTVDLPVGWAPSIVVVALGPTDPSPDAVAPTPHAKPAGDQADNDNSPPLRSASLHVNQDGKLYRLTFGPSIDALKQVDPSSDRVQGKWSRQGREILCQAGTHARLKLPAKIEGDYELDVVFTRNSGDRICVVFPVGDTQADVTLSNAVSGLEAINGRRFDDPSNSYLKRPTQIENDRRHNLQIIVRAIPGYAKINVYLDGETYFSWTGEQKSLRAGPAWSLSDTTKAGLGADNSAAVFHSATLRPSLRLVPDSPDNNQ